MVLGLLLWSITTMSSSFVHRGQFGWFLFLRGCVGVGEASYSTIAPTIIADLFTKERRSKMLAIFYFAIPVGSGMGYIVGAEIAKAFNSWQWAFRFTPIIGFVCCVLLYFLLTDPVRGEAEGGENMHATSWFTDIKALSRNRSFMGNTFGFTCVTFAAGSLAVFGPQFMGHALRQKHHVEEASISLLFGIITVLAGFCGVAIGSVSSTRFGKYTPRADPIICAIGLLGCTPFLFLSLTLSKDQPTMTWIFIFVGETLLFLNWPIVTDMVLYTVLPTRRSTAEAMQILISHALGDAISPLLVGEIAKSVQGNKEKTEFVQWQALQYALFMTCFVTVVGGLFFFYTALYIEADRNEVDAAIHEVHKIEENATNGIPSSATQETLASRTEIVVS